MGDTRIGMVGVADHPEDFAAGPGRPGIAWVDPDGLAGRYADQLGTTAAVVHKRRTSGRESHALQVVGDVAGRPCLIVDDMIAAGGTIAGCLDALG